jgi:hypothetical protein
MSQSTKIREMGAIDRFLVESMISSKGVDRIAVCVTSRNGGCLQNWLKMLKFLNRKLSFGQL